MQKKTQEDRKMIIAKSGLHAIICVSGSDTLDSLAEKAA